MEFRYQMRGVEHVVRLDAGPDGTYRAEIGGRVYHVQLQGCQVNRLDVAVDGRRYTALTARGESGTPGWERRYVALSGHTMPGEPRTMRHYEFTPLASERTRPQTSSAVRHGPARGSLEAQMPGQVVQIMVAEGEHVRAGQPLLVLEAMKMATRVVAPVEGRVTRLRVQVGDTVERGQRLLDVEPG